MRARDRCFSGTGSGAGRRLLYNFLVVLGRDEVEEDCDMFAVCGRLRRARAALLSAAVTDPGAQ